MVNKKIKKKRTFFGPQIAQIYSVRCRIRLRRTSARGTGISKIVHAPNLENKIGAGSALILSLRNSGENTKRFNVKRDKISTQSYFALHFLRKACPERSRRANPPNKSSKSVAG